MAQSESHAYIIESKPYRETSRMVRVLTFQEGIITLIAKGISRGKKGAPSTEPFSLVEIHYSLANGKTIGNLYRIESVENYPALRIHLPAYALASYWFELLKEVGKDHLDIEVIFPLTRDFLITLNSREDNYREVFFLFFRLIQALGFGIENYECVSCRHPLSESAAFNRNQGGFICRECLGSSRLPVISRELFSALQDRTKMAVMPPSVFKQGMELMHSHVTFHLEKNLKSFEFLKSLL